MRVALAVPVIALTMWVLPGCGTLARLGLSSRAGGASGGETVTDLARELEEAPLDRLESELLDEAARRIARAGGAEREELVRLRGEALLDLTVLALAIASEDPEASSRLLRRVAEAVGLDAGAPGFPVALGASLSAAVDADGHYGARAGRVPSLVAPPPELEQPERVWLGWATEDPWLGARARALAWGRAMSRVDAWLRGGTGGGGDSLVRDCGFLCAPSDAPQELRGLAEAAGYSCDEDGSGETWAALAESRYLPAPDWEPMRWVRTCGPERFHLPETAGAPLLLSPENFLDAVALLGLARLAADVERDARDAERIARLLLPWAGEWRRRLLESAVPQMLPANVVSTDPQLILPLVFDPSPPGLEGAFLEEPQGRIVVVSARSLRVAVRPHLALESDPDFGGFRLRYAEQAPGWQLPGREVVAFDAPSSLPPESVGEMGIDALAEVMSELETSLWTQTWWSERAGVGEMGGPGGERPVSLLIDGAAYVGTIRVVVETLRASGYERLVFHAWDAASGRLAVVPIAIAAEPEPQAQRLIIRHDGFAIASAGSAGDEEPRLIPRGSGEPLDALHAAIEVSFVEEFLDSSAPLVVQIDDGAMDWGILVHVLGAILWEREEREEATDRALLRAPVRVLDGFPVPLAPGGLRVWL